ncbi:MAG: hypothetical protein MI723_05310 [Caulobacterales bacterium]|nr:hypothetical protein [Caulobacterales bacterium]
MSGVDPSSLQGLVVLLLAAGFITASTALYLARRVRRAERQASEPASPAAEPAEAADAPPIDDTPLSEEPDDDAAQEELERLRQEKARIDAEKRREEFWREAEAGFVRYVKSLGENPDEPLIYTFIPFGVGMGIAALLDARLFVIQSGSKRVPIAFDKVRRFKFVVGGANRYDLHVFVSSIETPRLVVAHLDVASMDRWNEIYLRIKEGRL